MKQLRALRNVIKNVLRRFSIKEMDAVGLKTTLASAAAREANLAVHEANFVEQVADWIGGPEPGILVINPLDEVVVRGSSLNVITHFRVNFFKR